MSVEESVCLDRKIRRDERKASDLQRISYDNHNKIQEQVQIGSFSRRKSSRRPLAVSFFFCCERERERDVDNLEARFIRKKKKKKAFQESKMIYVSRCIMSAETLEVIEFFDFFFLHFSSRAPACHFWGEGQYKRILK